MRDNADGKWVAPADRATFTEPPCGGYKESDLGPWGFENYLESKQITHYDSGNPWSWHLEDGA